jgi:hypothetical protein
MRGLDPRIHVLSRGVKAWMPAELVPGLEGPQLKPGQDETGKRDSVEQLLINSDAREPRIAVILV